MTPGLGMALPPPGEQFCEVYPDTGILASWEGITRKRFFLGRRDARAPLLRWEATARGGDDDPWGHIEDFGWSWDTRFSEDENLLNLAFAVSHNTYRFNRGMKCGLYGAVLCRHKDG
eukprot:symbB.v1.2.012391.t1/scaffold857.1/size218589/6